MYKMIIISKETNESNGIEVITDKFGELRLNERHVQQQLELKKFTCTYKQIQRRIQQMQI